MKPMVAPTVAKITTPSPGIHAAADAPASTTTRNDASHAAAPAAAGAGATDDPAAARAAAKVQQGHALVRNGDLLAARLMYAEALGNMKDAMRQHLRAATWPDGMVGLFAASYQQSVLQGDIAPESQWPSLASRQEASGRFAAGSPASHADWFEASGAQLAALKQLPPLGSTRLYGFVSTPVSPSDFNTLVRQRDHPVVVGAAAGLLDRWRDGAASKWSASYFTSRGIKDVEIKAGTLPYGDSVIQKFVDDFDFNFTASVDQAGNTGNENDAATKRKVSTLEFSGAPAPISMGAYVEAVMAPTDGGSASVHTDGTKTGDNYGVPYSFGRTSKELFAYLKLKWDEIPHHLQGAPQCEHANVKECVDGALDEDPERDVAWERIQCNQGCQWQFYLGPAVSGSHPHYHAPAFNALLRGRKRWFVIPPQYNMSHLSGGVLRTAYEWVTSEVPRLRQEGIPISEFVQLPGEVVYVPEGWTHAIINLEPSVGIAFEVQHSLPPAAIEPKQARTEDRHGGDALQQQRQTQQRYHRTTEAKTEAKLRPISPTSSLASWTTASELIIMHAGGRGNQGPPPISNADSAVLDAVDRLRGIDADGPPCYMQSNGCSAASALSSSINVIDLLNATSDKNGKNQSQALVTIKHAAFSRVLPEKEMTTHSLLHTKRVGGGIGWPRVDATQFPSYAKARGWSYQVNAGDTLYIPAFWWHWVRSDGSPAVAFNIWTNKPHRNTFKPGCQPDADYACGRVPTLVPGDAYNWPARTKWTLPHIQERYHSARADEQEKESPELLGTCAASDSIYPEMWGTRVMGVSPWHVLGAPRKPKSIDDFAQVIANQTVGDVCHLHLPLEHMPRDMLNDIVMPQGSRPPSANAAQPVSMNLWITGGSLQSGLHFDSHYNSLTVLSGTKTVFLFPPTETKYLYKVGNVQASEEFGSSEPVSRKEFPTSLKQPEAPAADRIEANVEQGRAAAKAGNYTSAQWFYAKALTHDNIDQLGAVVNALSHAASWPAPMVGMVASKYQGDVQKGRVRPSGQWPALSYREEASSVFSDGIAGEWFTASEAETQALNALCTMPNSNCNADQKGSSHDHQLFGFTETVPTNALDPHIRKHDVPTVFGAASGVANKFRDAIFSRWDAAFFEAMDTVVLPVATVPYGNYIYGASGPDEGGDSKAATSQGCRYKKSTANGKSICWGSTPEKVTVRDFVRLVMQNDGGSTTGDDGNGGAPDAGATAVPYTFSTVSGELFDRLELDKSFRDGVLPKEMHGTVFCKHDNLDPHNTCQLVEAAAAAPPTKVTEDEAAAARAQKTKRLEYCNRGCAWQFYLGPAASGSQPHLHSAAFNILARGKKQWFVFPPQYTLDEITAGGTVQTAYEWVKTTLPALKRRNDVRLSEFVQLPGEVVYVPDGWIHAVLNVEPSVGVAFEVKHGVVVDS